jgi:predicted RNA-binding Zn ribbon-like protein
VDFNSHTDAVVAVTTELVNCATPGTRRGRDYRVPEGDGLVAAVNAALGTGRAHRSPLDAVPAGALARTAVELRAVFEYVEGGDLDSAARAVNVLLARVHPVPYLDRHDGEPWHLHFHSPDGERAASWAAGCAVALATVLGTEYADRLGVCSAPECDRVYVDTSRNGTRRFCSTACQNRVKSAAHRSRAER